jgi:uncharacterized protein involved in outer membrane biogenesis
VPPAAIDGHVAVHGKRITLRGVEATLGSSRVLARADLDFGGEVPKIDGTITAPTLRIEDVTSLGAASGKGEEGAGKPAAPSPGGAWLFSETPFSLDVLRAVDLHLNVLVKTLAGDAAAAIVHDASADIRIADGRLAVKPLGIAVAGGRVDGDMAIDGTKRGAPPFFAADFKIAHMDLATLLQPFLGGKKLGRDPAERVVEGRFGGTVRLDSMGDSLRQLAERLRGDIGLALERGGIDRIVVAAAGLDLLPLAVDWFKKNKSLPLNCLVAHLPIDQGVIHADSFVLDTAAADILVRGEVDLGRETIDLTLHDYPKVIEVGSLRTPVTVHGPLRHPQVALGKGPLAVRAAAAGGLAAALAPAAALGALVDTSLGRSDACRAYVQEIVRMQTGAVQPAH